MWKIRKLTACVLLLTLLCGCSGQETKKEAAMLYTGDETSEEKSELETKKVEKGDYVEQTTVNASLHYLKEVSILVDVENAELRDIKVKVGDKVNKGDVVATYKVNQSKASLEREKLEIQNERSAYNASLRQQQNEIKEMERKIKNAENSEQKKALQEQLRQANQQLGQFKQTESSILEKEKDYRETVAAGKKTKLVSPYTGIVSKVISEDTEYFEQGTEVATLRTESDFLIAAEDTENALRYNMDVTVLLGGDRNDIRSKLSGKVISASNLTAAESSGESSEEGSEASTVYIRVSKKDRKKYDFEKNNIYVQYEKMRIKDCLLVDGDVINSEVDGADSKFFVWLVQNGNLYKRYIQKAFEDDAESQDGEDVADGKTVTENKVWVLQGVEEGQELALADSVK